MSTDKTEGSDQFDFDGLVAANAIYLEKVRSVHSEEAIVNSLIQLSAVVEQFFKSLPPEDHFELVELHDEDKVLSSISNRFHEFASGFFETGKPLQPAIRMLLLEVAVGSFNRSVNFSIHYIRKKINSAVERAIKSGVASVVTGKVMEYKEQKRREDHQAMADFYQSRDMAKESDPNLTATEKVRVFENAVKSFNNTGLLRDFSGNGLCSRIYFDLLETSPHAISALKRVFLENEHLTVETVMEVFSKCGECRARYGTTNVDGDEFYIAKGSNLSFLLTHFEEILGRLNLTEKVYWKRIVFLSKDALFGRGK